jgi:hypothetical protein
MQPNLPVCTGDPLKSRCCRYTVSSVSYVRRLSARAVRPDGRCYHPSVVAITHAARQVRLQCCLLLQVNFMTDRCLLTLTLKMVDSFRG